MARIHVLHENEEWLSPLRAAFECRNLPFVEWHMAEGGFDLEAEPPEGVFYNRMSASSHTRGHEFAPELTASVLAWLEGHGRRVVNSSRALALEVSKVRQYAALKAEGVLTPATRFAVGRKAVMKAAGEMGVPLVLKPNRGGKGLGVQLFNDLDALEAYVESDQFDAGRDGTVLLQQYVTSPETAIVRAEFVGGRFLYAVRVDTSEGFELCPADACRIDDAFCPVGDAGRRPLFEIIDGFEHENIGRYRRFLTANGIEVAGIEMITDENGVAWTYDVNTNTNYNPDAERAAGLDGTDRSGMGAVAAFLGRELEGLGAQACAAAE